MKELFLHLFNMSITASYIILAVIVLRFLLKKMPTKYSCLLWILAAIRLVLPFSFESALSLLPSVNTFVPEILHTQQPAIDSGFTAVDNVINPILFNPDRNENPINLITHIGLIVWITGMVFLVAYSFFTYYQLKKRITASIRLYENVYQCDQILSPFVLGIIKPKIYIPFSINDEDVEYILKHENVHIKRRDHWIKPFGFVLLIIYWFNPFVWIAYNLLCRDIEFACDEMVLEQMGITEKKPYSEALLKSSAVHRNIAFCPVAFGEVGVRQRVKNILSFKKPRLWLIMFAVFAFVAAAICFLTNPINETGRIEGKKIHRVTYYTPELIASGQNPDLHEFLANELILLMNRNGHSKFQAVDNYEVSNYNWIVIFETRDPADEYQLISSNSGYLLNWVHHQGELITVKTSNMNPGFETTNGFPWWLIGFKSLIDSKEANPGMPMLTISKFDLDRGGGPVSTVSFSITPNTQKLANDLVNADLSHMKTFETRGNRMASTSYMLISIPRDWIDVPFEDAPIEWYASGALIIYKVYVDKENNPVMILSNGEGMFLSQEIYDTILSIFEKSD
jgi:beta-lactamase regulating signal transducer with metallopeptidase domain